MAHELSNKTLGDVVREGRIARGCSLRDLAKLVDKTPSYLSDIENNRRVPAEDVLRVLARELDLDFDELMARAGRFGEDAVRYMQRTPAAGVLFRRVSERELGEKDLQKVSQFIEDLGRKGKA